MTIMKIEKYLILSLCLLMIKILETSEMSLSTLTSCPTMVRTIVGQDVRVDNDVSYLSVVTSDIIGKTVEVCS